MPKRCSARSYHVWEAMRQRCNNPRLRTYKYYGGRGIKIDPSWNSYATFLHDMGEPPLGLTLDRIDNNGDYSPANCRWVDRVVQVRNSRQTKLNTEAAKVIRYLYPKFAARGRKAVRTLAGVHGVTWTVPYAIHIGRTWRERSDA